MGRLASEDRLTKAELAARARHLEDRAGSSIGKSKPLPPPEHPGDPYPARVAKYIPAEVVALYLASRSLIEARLGDVAIGSPEHQHAGHWMNAAFVLGLVGTPVYLFINKKTGEPWVVNTALATIAFPLWANALHCKFGWFADADQMVAGLLLIFYTFVAAMLKPWL